MGARAPERVDGEEPGALAHRSLDACKTQNRPQRRSDARGPCEGEGDAGEKRTAAAGPLDQVEWTPFPVEPEDERRGDEEDAEQQDRDARNLPEEGLIVEEQGADRGGAQAEQDEDRLGESITPNLRRRGGEFPHDRSLLS